ncbi:MAG: response regulator transcription factor [Chloroflexi bacterium]|nr:response regulator transcription factor [Chloroflexota bacterium]MCH8224111.1 response regulator transcription factor [Chloroflexota bacterium]
MIRSTKQGASILIVDDDPKIRRLLARHMATEGYEILLAAHGEEALYQASLNQPSLIILDLAMPVMGGLVALERLRQWYSEPIIILSATDQEREKVRALDLGADDYVTKPFSFSELAARVRASIRRAERLSTSDNVDAPVVCAGDIEIDLAAHVVRKGSKEVRLTRTEYDLIQALATHADKVLTHRQLLQTVWGPEYGQETDYLRTFIKQLRRKLETDPSRPQHIITEPGVGYRLITA